MRHTLLKMVQLILSSMDSDEVSDINETTESVQVVDTIEQCFNDIVDTIDFPEHFELVELDPSLDPSRPTLMYVPEDIARIEWIKYEHADGTEKLLKPVWPMARSVFFNRMNSLDTSRTEVYQFNWLNSEGETFDVRGWNDRPPSYYTVLDNRTVLFDSYDADQSTTLTANRTQCYGLRLPVFVRSNTFVPPLEPRQFSLLFNEAKAQAFTDLKQVENVRAERKARRGWNFSQRKKATTEGSPIHHTFTSNYGRRGCKR